VGRRLGLSGRELEIVRLLCEGQKAVAIARELKISRNTVATHLKRLYRKLEVHDRARLVMLVLSAATPGDGHSHSS
jgi:DNA-binding CsgD family transcriptional regulator